MAPLSSLSPNQQSQQFVASQQTTTSEFGAINSDDANDCINCTCKPDRAIDNQGKAKEKLRLFSLRQIQYLKGLAELKYGKALNNFSSKAHTEVRKKSWVTLVASATLIVAFIALCFFSLHVKNRQTSEAIYKCVDKDLDLARKRAFDETSLHQTFASMVSDQPLKTTPARVK